MSVAHNGRFITCCNTEFGRLSVTPRIDSGRVGPPAKRRRWFGQVVGTLGNSEKGVSIQVPTFCQVA